MMYVNNLLLKIGNLNDNGHWTMGPNLQFNPLLVKARSIKEFKC